MNSIGKFILQDYSLLSTLLMVLNYIQCVYLNDLIQPNLF